MSNQHTGKWLRLTARKERKRADRLLEENAVLRQKLADLGHPVDRGTYPVNPQEVA